MFRNLLTIIGLSLLFSVSAAFACPDQPEESQALTSTRHSVLIADAVDAWDEVEDGAEDIGSAIERQWERVEDGVFGEDAEERAEEAEERREDRLEEIEEERAKRN